MIHLKQAYADMIKIIKQLFFILYICYSTLITMFYSRVLVSSLIKESLLS